MTLSENEKEDLMARKRHKLGEFEDEQTALKKDEIDENTKQYHLSISKEISQLRELKKAVQELVSFYARPSIEPHKVTETWRKIKKLADC